MHERRYPLVVAAVTPSDCEFSCSYLFVRATLRQFPCRISRYFGADPGGPVLFFFFFIPSLITFNLKQPRPKTLSRLNHRFPLIESENFDNRIMKNSYLQRCVAHRCLLQHAVLYAARYTHMSATRACTRLAVSRRRINKLRCLGGTTRDKVRPVS